MCRDWSGSTTNKSTDGLNFYPLPFLFAYVVIGPCMEARIFQAFDYNVCLQTLHQIASMVK